MSAEDKPSHQSPSRPRCDAAKTAVLLRDLDGKFVDPPDACQKCGSAWLVLLGGDLYCGACCHKVATDGQPKKPDPRTRNRPQISCLHCKSNDNWTMPDGCVQCLGCGRIIDVDVNALRGQLKWKIAYYEKQLSQEPDLSPLLRESIQHFINRKKQQLAMMSDAKSI